MDIIKITGAAVVLMSSFMLGMYFVVVNKTRIKNLADIDETWRTISAEIRFQSGSLPEIFKRFASHEYSFGIKALYKDVLSCKFFDFVCYIHYFVFLFRGGKLAHLFVIMAVVSEVMAS